MKYLTLFILVFAITACNDSGLSAKKFSKYETETRPMKKDSKYLVVTISLPAKPTFDELIDIQNDILKNKPTWRHVICTHTDTITASRISGIQRNWKPLEKPNWKTKVYGKKGRRYSSTRATFKALISTTIIRTGQNAL